MGITVGIHLDVPHANEEGEVTRGNKTRRAAGAGTGNVRDWGALSPGHPHTPGRDAGCDVAAHTGRAEPEREPAPEPERRSSRGGPAAVYYR